jgi:hypothetical protein
MNIIDVLHELAAHAHHSARVCSYEHYIHEISHM